MSDNLNIFIFYIWCCGRRLPNKAQRLDHDRANAPQRIATKRGARFRTVKFPLAQNININDNPTEALHLV